VMSRRTGGPSRAEFDGLIDLSSGFRLHAARGVTRGAQRGLKVPNNCLASLQPLQGRHWEHNMLVQDSCSEASQTHVKSLPENKGGRVGCRGLS
jgi:hypothetical protein